ncbi:MAG: transglycosylase SLT domain-containing protein [Bacteroidia bacterium]|nr:transglycosylase SLT domain-containing protein [Bacteroidia bacterium]
MKSKILLIALIAGMLPATVFSQYRMNYVPLYNYKDEAEPIHEILDLFDKDYTYDNPISNIYDTLIYNTHNYNKYEVPVFSSEVINTRLRSLPTIIPMDYNQYVQRYIDVYTIEKRDRVAQILGLTDVYFPLIEQELDRQNMPMELKYLSIVESALNPHAKSRAGATGLWQFMLATGQEYGLKVDSYVDERRDPYKSTVAAISYLKKAHETFGDWLLAIASYNCGAGNVRKAINRAGGVYDFWAIRDYLPAETRGYVPAFIAATYSFNYFYDHNIYPIHTTFRLNQDTVHIKNLNLSLYEIAQLTGANVEELQNLNPELKMGAIPYSSYESYILRVPSSVSDYFSRYEGYIAEKYGPRYYASTPASQVVYYHADGSVSSSPTVNSTSFENTPSPTESQAEIERNNQLAAARVAQPQVKAVAPVTKPAATPAKTTTPAKPATTAAAKYHTVKKGDTLWEIGQKYNVSVDALRKLNGSAVKQLNPGEKVRIK